MEISCEQLAISQQDIPTSETLEAKILETTKAIETIQPSCELVLKINREVKDLILNYTLWAAILGTFAFNYRHLDNYTLPLLALINLKMVLDIGTLWSRPEKTMGDRDSVS